jgi:ribosomal-protein-alanine N-acetyltransferase
LIRGNTAFLADTSDWTAERAGGVVMSPALYPTATRIWKRVGYQQDIELMIMEKRLETKDIDSVRVQSVADPDLLLLEAVDRLAFDDFWQMDAAGLQEALDATPRRCVFQVGVDDEVAGYAIVGAQLGVSYLQRIAVDPAKQGQGVGTDLIQASLAWAASTGATAMVLNVREENQVARSVYRTQGFIETKNTLQVLRYQA